MLMWKIVERSKASILYIYIDEEGEDWDERDKANYEKNEQFENFTTKTMAMKEKMEKMQLAFRKNQGMDDCLYNMCVYLYGF